MKNVSFDRSKSNDSLMFVPFLEPHLSDLSGLTQLKFNSQSEPLLPNDAGEQCSANIFHNLLVISLENAKR